MNRILIIEDEEGIRRLLRYDLRQMNFDVDSAKDGNEGYYFAAEHDYDVIIVDWMLPGYSGIEIVGKLREAGKDAIIIMLTAKNDESDILEAFEAGVDDYISKPFSPRELTARINAHLKRLNHSNERRTFTVGDIQVNLDEHVVTLHNEPVELTKKEYDLLVFLLENHNVVLSRDQILTEIWNFDYDGDTRIVDVHIFKLRAKLEKSEVRIQSMRGVGYVAKTK